MSRSDTILELKKLGFSSNSLKKLDIYVQYLLDYNKKYNLISKSTEKQVWKRHILDCAQLIKYIEFENKKKIADFGSGAGLPGIIISIFDENYKFHVKLYEKSVIKKQFLTDCRKKLDIKFDLCNNVYEDDVVADIVICRAFKKLGEIIDISREKIKKDHKIIILKGKNAQKEINNVSLTSNYSYKIKNSITDKNSKILIIDAKRN